MVNLLSTFLTMIKNIAFAVLLSLLSTLLCAQKEKLPRVVAGFPVNYDEDSVGAYVLPDLLTLRNGRKVTNARVWMEQRRPELVKLFEESQFGSVPPPPPGMHVEVFEKGTAVFNGKGVRKQVRVYFTKDTTHKMDLLIYLPAMSAKPAPLLLMINFVANASAVDDPGVRAGEVWTREGRKVPASSVPAVAKINVDTFLSQGLGLAMVYYGDIEPDFKTGIQYGIRGHYLKPGQTTPVVNEWGAIAAWSWGLSRAMDYFEKDKEINARRIALLGSSRLGKTVLWTGARDPRFKVVIASCSGEGGAALSRRNYGESINHMTDTSRYFYQFAPNRHRFAADPAQSPVDAHMLVALMAPRPLLLQTGNTDYWSDPKGEFLAARAAEPVYRLFGKQGTGSDKMPEAGTQTMLNTLGYYLHDGGHGIIPSDWPVFITYLKKYL
jgi:hypothetical protein